MINAWGTISVYIASYYHHSDSSVNLGTMFQVYIVAVIFEAFGLSSGYIVLGVACYHRFGPRITGALAGVMFVAGFLGCAYLSQADAFVWVYGVTIGLGAGYASFTPIWRAWEFFPLRQGLVTGLIVLGYGIGPGALGLLFTFLVNPHNEKPTLTVNRGITEDKLFTYDVAQKVPFALKTMACLFAGLFAISTALIFKAKVKREISESLASLISSKKDTQECPDFKTVLKSSAFWIMLISLFAGTSFGIYMTNAYKNYGLLHIHNDQLLSTIGFVAAGFNALGRVALPVVLDYTSFKLSYGVNSVLQIVVASTLFLTVNSPVWYCIWVSLSFLLFAGNFTGFAIESARIFGAK